MVPFPVGTHQPLPRWENPPLRRLFQFADLCLAANTGRFTKKWGDETPTCLQQVKQRFNVLKAMSQTIHPYVAMVNLGMVDPIA